MLNSLKMGLLGALQGYAQGRSKQLGEEEDFNKKMEYLKATNDSKNEILGIKQEFAQKQQEFANRLKEQAQDFKQQQFSYQQQHDAQVLDVRQKQYEAQNQNSLTRLELERTRLENAQNSPKNASAAQDAMNFREAQKEVNDMMKGFGKASEEDKKAMLQQYGIDDTDPEARSMYKAAVSQEVYSTLPQTSQDYMSTSGASATPFDDMQKSRNKAVNSGPPSSLAQPPPKEPGFFSKMFGGGGDESAPEAAAPPAPTTSMDASSLEGKKFKGSDGNMYIIQNGQKVLLATPNVQPQLMGNASY